MELPFWLQPVCEMGRYFTLTRRNRESRTSNSSSRWLRMLVKRWMVVVTGSLLLTVLLVWAHECQKPTPNYPDRPRPGESSLCSDREPCIWRESTRTDYGNFCSLKTETCPNHNPNAGPCSARQRWEVTFRTLRCVTADGRVCKTMHECLLRAEPKEATGYDCEGHPCLGHTTTSQ